VRADVSSSVIKAFFLVLFGYLDVTVQEKLRSGWPGPFVNVEGCLNGTKGSKKVESRCKTMEGKAARASASGTE
jgi:hypothetical protein